jgi:hypothetical protein
MGAIRPSRPRDRLAPAFPAVSLKNKAIGDEAEVADAGTRLSAPPATSAMQLPPMHGAHGEGEAGPDHSRASAAPAVRGVGAAEIFMRLTQSSTNYVGLGRRGFDALTGLIHKVPALAIDYPDTDTAVGLIDDFQRELAA